MSRITRIYKHLYALIAVIAALVMSVGFVFAWLASHDDMDLSGDGLKLTSDEIIFNCVITRNEEVEELNGDVFSGFLPGDYVYYNITITEYPYIAERLMVGIYDPQGSAITENEISSYTLPGYPSVTRTMCDMYQYSLISVNGIAETSISYPTDVPIGPNIDPINKFVQIITFTPAPIDGKINIVIKITYTPASDISINEAGILADKTFGYRGVSIRIL